MRAMVMLTAVLVTVLPASASASAAEPDLVRSLQWQIQALKLDQVHKRATGAGMVVAVVDSGVDAQHPDLSGQVLQGPDGATFDIDGRGTGLAGLIAGHGHGALGDAGILGIAPGAKILPVAFAPGVGEVGDPDRLATGLELAINRGAKIIVIGRGMVPAERLEFVIDVAVLKGILVVATDTVAWPASYPGVLSALPLDRSGTVTARAASGKSTGIAVPGVDLMTTDRAGGYRIADGSGPAAILAGAAAVVWSANPDATSVQVTDLLRRTATGGSLNLVAALETGVPKPAPSPEAASLSPKPAGPKDLTITNALANSGDWRRWTVVLPLVLFLTALAAWAYLAARRRPEP